MTDCRTLSEQTFESWCESCHIRYTRIPCEAGRTPDYDIHIGGTIVVVEVKQIDSNAREQANAELADRRGTHGVVTRIGERIRKKIANAGPQLSRRAKGKHSALLVLLNNVSIWDEVDSYDIRTAMYGFDQVVISITEGILDRKCGPKRKMTKECNTSISALAKLQRVIDGPPTLTIFHNIFAAIPLRPALLAQLPVSQYTLEEKRQRQFQDWVPVTGESAFYPKMIRG